MQVDDETENGADDIAPRPRPGFRSKSGLDAATKAQLVAGVMRACLGALGFATSLLYVPVTIATPILAGVCVLMMVTGSTPTWRAARLGPRRVTHVVLVICIFSVVASCALTVWVGPGGLNPMLQRVSHTNESPVIQFEPPPGR